MFSSGVPRVVGSIGSSTAIKAGQYTPEQLAAEVQRALNAMTGSDTDDSYVVTFEATGDKGRFSIGNTQCPFSLELQVNPNAASGAASSSPLPATHFLRALMGFQGRQYTGSRCYQGDPVPLLALSGFRVPTPQRIEPRPVGGEEVAGRGSPVPRQTGQKWAGGGEGGRKARMCVKGPARWAGL